MISLKKIPTTTKALSLHAVGDLKLENIDIEKLDQNSVLLKIKYCGICSSDIERIYKTGTYHFPTVPGHEFSGEVVGVYDEKDKELLGKKAAVFPLIPCKNCSACEIEEYAQCSNYNYFGSRCNGAYSQYLVVPKWNLVFFDNMDYDIAALCEPAAVALHSIRRIKIDKNDKILIMGSGTIGLLIASFLKTMVNKDNIYVGARRQASIEFIKKLGLNYIDTNNLSNEIDNKTNKEGFNCVFEAIGSNESISNSILSSSNFAKIVLVGNPKEDINIDKNVYWKILRKQITVTGTWNSNYATKINDWKDTLKFMKENSEIFKKLITNIYSLEEYREAFDLLKDKNKYKIKVMFKIDK